MYGIFSLGFWLVLHIHFCLWLAGFIEEAERRGTERSKSNPALGSYTRSTHSSYHLTRFLIIAQLWYHSFISFPFPHIPSSGGLLG